jgi:hypothetical protein
VQYVLAEVIGESPKDVLYRALGRLHLSVRVFTQFRHECSCRFLHIGVGWMRCHRVEYVRSHSVKRLDASLTIVQQIAKCSATIVLHADIVQLTRKAVDNL